MKKYRLLFAIIIITFTNCSTNTKKIISVKESDCKYNEEFYPLDCIDILFDDSSTMCFALLPADTTPEFLLRDGSDLIDDLSIYKTTNNSAFLINYLPPINNDFIDVIIPKNFRYNNRRFTVNGIINACFNSNNQIRSVTIPNTVSIIGNGVFQKCRELKHVILPNSVIEIGKGAFAYCEQLEEMPISDRVEVIRQSTYYGCSRIKEINIPNSIVRIEEAAFSEDRYKPMQIVSVNIPQSVEYISNTAFSGCRKLEAINVDPKNINYSSGDGVLFSNDTSVLHIYPSGKINTMFDIPSTVTKIDEKAFAGNQFISTINIPSSVKEIGEEAFCNCDGLTSIIIPNSVTTIKASTFSGCSCLSLVSLPNTITEIERYAFSLSGIKSITIPNSVTEIGEDCFLGCKSLENVTLSNSLYTINEEVFESCERLESIIFPSSIRTIKYRAFANTGLTFLEIPDNIQEIEPLAFQNCQNLAVVELSTLNFDMATDFIYSYPIRKLIMQGREININRH